MRVFACTRALDAELSKGHAVIAVQERGTLNVVARYVALRSGGLKREPKQNDFTRPEG